jgi:hypothetical protein
MTRAIGDKNDVVRYISMLADYDVSFRIMPQMDENRPWCIEIEVPAWDHDQVAYFSGTTLEQALMKAAEEYFKRHDARKSAWEVLNRKVVG